eukprot:scaffold7381_cov310-Pinguiococcus_pyrenoidosus.AAC.25
MRLARDRIRQHRSQLLEELRILGSKASQARPKLSACEPFRKCADREGGVVLHLMRRILQALSDDSQQILSVLLAALGTEVVEHLGNAPKGHGSITSRSGGLRELHDFRQHGVQVRNGMDAQALRGHAHEIAHGIHEDRVVIRVIEASAARSVFVDQGLALGLALQQEQHEGHDDVIDLRNHAVSGSNALQADLEQQQGGREGPSKVFAPLPSFLAGF